jgi:hypothetical protein
MKSIIIILLSLSSVALSFAENSNPPAGTVVDYKYSNTNEKNNFSIGYKTPEEAYSAISSIIGIEKVNAGDVDGFADITTGVFWVFTNHKNPAHPAAMKLKAFESSGNLLMQAKVLCGAIKAECDKFVSYQQYLTNSVTALYWANKEYLKTPNKAFQPAPAALDSL